MCVLAAGTLLFGPGSGADAWAAEGDSTQVISLSVDAESVTEGAVAGITLTRSGDVAEELRLTAQVHESDAMLASPAETPRGEPIIRNLRFSASSTSATLQEATVDDTTHEPASGITFCPNTGRADVYTIEYPVCASVTVLDNDDPPVLSVMDSVGTEDSVRNLRFEVGLSEESGFDIAVDYATSNGTATAGDDYTATTGTLRFAAGQVANTINVPVLMDGSPEENETFTVALSSAVNATIGDSTGTGTIRDDDPEPTALSVTDATADESDATIDFTVWLNQRPDREVTVDYATSDGTAVSGEDYRSATGTLTFPPGDNHETVSVELLGDDVQEADETFSLTLSDAVGATLRDSTGTGTIRDDEERPLMTITGSQASEAGLLDFVVTLSAASQVTVTVDYVTEETFNIYTGPDALTLADPGIDFEIQAGKLTFAPGETSKTIQVQVLDDGVDEPVEAVVVTLKKPVNAEFEQRRGSDTCPWRGCNDTKCCDCGTILDDDVIELSIGDAMAPEYASHLEFVVELATQAESEVSVSYASSDGTALAGQDYQSVSGSLTFQPGTVRQVIQVAPLDDDIAEPSETFVVTLSGPVGATLVDAQGTGTITDNDDPAFSIAGGTGVEGSAVDFTVTLAGPSSQSATVSYATSDGTAVAVDDYGATSGTLTFAPGESSQTVSVLLVDDEIDEADETFAMTLSSATNATIDTGVANGTILDNDGNPQLLVRGATGGEGDELAFEVTLAGSSEQTVTVSYATSDGTAVAGEDYEAVSGMLTFAPGKSVLTVFVSVLDDALYEPEEHFSLELSSPANATLAVRSVTGTIIDDDRAGKAPTQGWALLFESTTRAGRQGFVRVINHSADAGEFFIEAVDDSGMRVGPLTLTIGAGMAKHFNSDDFESGNIDKGIPVSVGPPSAGSWRLELSSDLDIEVLSYARTSDGFVTSLHDTAPATVGVHRAVFMNPGGNVDQVSRLRLINPGTADALVTITGTDDMGGMSAGVVVDLPAGTAREWTAAELESGAGTNGALGAGEGKWRLEISSDRPVVAMSLIESSTGHLTNLSTLPHMPGRAPGSYAVPLFPSASDPMGRQGFVRVVNRSGDAREVRIEAFDHTDREYGPLALALGADEVASFNSDDLELGNAAKGLTGSTGSGEGDWWLELSSEEDGDIEVWAYIRTTDGFLASMHDLVPEAEGDHRVVFFNPAENANQVSVLWLVNPGDADARGHDHGRGRQCGLAGHGSPDDGARRVVAEAVFGGPGVGRRRGHRERRVGRRGGQVAPLRRLGPAHPGHEPARESHRAPHQSVDGTQS